MLFLKTEDMNTYYIRYSEAHALFCDKYKIQDCKHVRRRNAKVRQNPIMSGVNWIAQRVAMAMWPST